MKLFTVGILTARGVTSSLVRTSPRPRQLAFPLYQFTRFQSQNHQQVQSHGSNHNKISTPIQSPPTPPLPESLRKTIPGETEQSNSLMSRLPTFPLRNTATLLPKPGVPTAANFSLRSMIEILRNKKEPELIYEAEPHKLYFLICGMMAFVFTIYTLTFLDWGVSSVLKLYEDDHDTLMFAARLALCAGLGVFAGGIVWTAMNVPTRLIRRMWYLPGPTPHIRFTSHPLLPGRPTPVYTVPLNNLGRGLKSKVFTSNGIYGTLDKATFFFLLKETDKKFGFWMVDRNGWFWGDGRVFDVIFGKESLEDAAKGVSYASKLKEASDKVLEEKQKLKEEHGPFWQAKVANQMAKKDIKKLIGIVEGKDKKLPKD